MFFAPLLIRKIVKVIKIGFVGFVLGVGACTVASLVSCAPALDQAGNIVQASAASRIDVYVENQSFDDHTIYIMWEGHSPVRIGRVGSVSNTKIKNVLSHTKNLYFVAKRFPGGEQYVIGPLMVTGLMDVRLILRNSQIQSLILPIPKA